jgi:hypothetical protein
MRTVSRGSPVDPRWSIRGMVLSQIRHGRSNAPVDSPLTLQEVLASEDYRNLMTAKVAVGDRAPDFERGRTRTSVPLPQGMNATGIAADPTTGRLWVNNSYPPPAN